MLLQAQTQILRALASSRPLQTCLQITPETVKVTLDNPQKMGMPQTHFIVRFHHPHSNLDNRDRTDIRDSLVLFRTSKQADFEPTSRSHPRDYQAQSLKPKQSGFALGTLEPEFRTTSQSFQSDALYSRGRARAQPKAGSRTSQLPTHNIITGEKCNALTVLIQTSEDRYKLLTKNVSITTAHA
jgi:hypothetical protein